MRAMYTLNESGRTGKRTRQPHSLDPPAARGYAIAVLGRGVAARKKARWPSVAALAPGRWPFRGDSGAGVDNWSGLPTTANARAVA
eukprot:355749-Chlamydomonas_euryale.AAC.3